MKPNSKLSLKEIRTLKILLLSALVITGILSALALTYGTRIETGPLKPRESYQIKPDNSQAQAIDTDANKMDDIIDFCKGRSCQHDFDYCEIFPDCEIG